jgi:hypothetical protein
MFLLKIICHVVNIWHLDVSVLDLFCSIVRLICTLFKQKRKKKKTKLLIKKKTGCKRYRPEFRLAAGP